MNKFELWKKYELFELFNDLDAAQTILAKIQGGYSGNFISAEAFCEALKDELHDLNHQNVPDFKQICLWFAPTSVWDDFVGLKGTELANRILERANRWDMAQL